MPLPDRVLTVIPAWGEEESLSRVLTEVRAAHRPVEAPDDRHRRTG